MRVKTFIEIDEEIKKEAKVFAAINNTTLTAYVEKALIAENQKNKEKNESPIL
jgi:hypothetical protein